MVDVEALRGNAGKWLPGLFLGGLMMAVAVAFAFGAIDVPFLYRSTGN